MAIPPKYDRPWNPPQTSGNKDYSIPVPEPIGKPWQDYNAGNSSSNNSGEKYAPPLYTEYTAGNSGGSPQWKPPSQRKGGVNLAQIKKNFNDYQSNSGGINFDKYKTPTDDKVYMGGSKYFNESTGQYEKPHKMPSIGKYTGIDQDGNLVHPEKHAAEAQQYKDRYKNDLKKYMNYNGDKITNTNTSEENNFDQNAGNKQDWLTNIGDYNDIKYSNIGNDYSVNIAGIGDGFSNMQGAAAYTALNNNQHERSKSDINGLKRAAQASEQATGLVGAKNRAANLYNSLGYSQNYWRQKADAQQNFYLGDIFAQKAPDYQLPASPSDPMDNDTTQDTLDDFKKELD